MSHKSSQSNNYEKNDMIDLSKNSEKSKNLSEISSNLDNNSKSNKKSAGSRNKNFLKLHENSKSNRSEINSLKSSSKISYNSSINSITKYKVKNPVTEKQMIKQKSSSLQSSMIGNEQQKEATQDMTCKLRIIRFFESYNIHHHMEFVVSIISLLSFIYYVICTYINKLFKYLNYIDYFIGFVYIIGHIVNILIAHQPFRYLYTNDSLIYFIIEIPPFFANICDNYYLDSYYRAINISRIMRLIKAMNLIEILLGKEINETNQIISIISNLIMLILLTGGTIQQLDLGYVEKTAKITYDTFARKMLLLRKNFHHYIYFSIVTLTTVGYGDIVPQTILSKLMIIFISMFVLFYVPQQTSKLMALYDNQTVYQRKKYILSENIPFVVLMGDIQLESLKSFCSEYFHKDHGDNFKQIVILMSKPPSKNMEHFLNYKDNSKFIIYLQGKPTDDQDLLRTGLLSSKSCIIFTNKNALNPNIADYQSLMLSLYLKKYFWHNSNKNGKNTPFKLCLQINKQKNCKHYFLGLQNIYKKYMSSDILLVIESLKINLLSKSCLTPGIISLISNLVISSGIKNTSYINESDWIKEYIEGQQYEIYKYNNIKGELLFYSFQGLVQEVYKRYHAILIALEINYKGGTLVKLNPQNKENIIDMIYSAFFAKNRSKYTEYDNKEDQEEDSLLDISAQGSEDELDYKKKYNLNFKHLKINAYCISSDKSIIDNLKKLDEGKDNPDKSDEVVSKFSHFSKKEVLTRKMTRITGVSDDESEFINEDIENNSTKQLLYVENSSELYENEFLNDYYTLDDIEKNSLYSHQRINEQNNIKNHIVICGMHPELINFIRPLRSKNLPIKLLKWIVILAPTLPQEAHDILIKFPKIIFIQGAPLLTENLLRANIMTADIAIILRTNLDNIDENYENAGQDNNDNDDEDEEEDEQKEENNNDVIDDSKTLFIYQAIKKLNSSIQIIAELLNINNIELLLSAKSLKKLYDSKIYTKNNSSQAQINDEDEEKKFNYKLAPIYAAGEVYLPSVIDRITSQISYNSNLLTILNLLLIGEKSPEKNADKNIDKVLKLSGSNLFLIPCEERNESFNDMFKRLLIQYKMVSIALYRKNEEDNFYFVYTNPKKTTLIRQNDKVFVLSSTENIISYYEKNLLWINYSNDSTAEEKKNNNDSIDEDDKNNINDESSKFSKVFQKAIEQHLNNNLTGGEKPIQVDQVKTIEKKLTANIGMKIHNTMRSVFQNKERTTKRYNSVFKRMEVKRGKYAEIDNIQSRFDKGIEKLRYINEQCNNFQRDIDKHIKKEISDEFKFYINGN